MSAPEADTIAGAPVAPGDILAGKYRVERVLGVGGMGVVVSAKHVELNELVALKFLLPAALDRPGNVARFLREAQSAIRIKSEHVARVTDVGKLESGAPYIVMEYLSGSDLGELLKKNGPLSIADAVDYVLQASEAIAEAHALGIVHRDLKPSNLFLTTRLGGSRLVKVLDFGIAKLLAKEDDGKQSLTSTSSMMGSPRYMAPEQVRSAKRVDARSDIWALGVILFELLTDREPFNGDTLHELLAAIVLENALSAKSFRPEIPDGLEAVLQRCFQKDPDARYQHIGLLAKDLAPFAPKSHLSVERIVSIAGDTGAAPPSSEPISAEEGAPTVQETPRFLLAESSDEPRKPSPGAVTADSWTSGGGRKSTAIPSVLVTVGIVAAAGLAGWYFRHPTATPTNASSEPSMVLSAASVIAPTKPAIEAPPVITSAAPTTADAAPSASAAASARHPAGGVKAPVKKTTNALPDSRD